MPRRLGDGDHLVWDPHQHQFVSVTELPVRNSNARYLHVQLDNWLSRAAQLPGRALHVALGIQFETAVQRKSTIQLGNHLLRSWGVNYDAKRRGLQALEAAGLITVEYRLQANPVVTVCQAETAAKRLHLVGEES
jgi:hypothetical protein